MAQFLKFQDAVEITNQMIQFFNSPQSDPAILYLAGKFNLDIKPNFYVQVASITANCPECSGCHGGSCTLGCYMSQHKGDAGNLCYWSVALEKVAGTKLVVHEMGHVIYDQIFEDHLDPDKSFDKSEKFSQFFENNFDIDMKFHPDGVTLNPESINFNLHESGIRIAELIIVLTVVTIVGIVLNAKLTKKI